MKIKDLFEANQMPGNYKPKIGWWLDSNPVTFYHGTHRSRLQDILQNGLKAPEKGPTAGWVSLALEPNTASGYASMSGGEASFRQAGGNAKHVPVEERIVLILKVPQEYFLSKMPGFAGNLELQKSHLENKELYLEWVKNHTKDNVYNPAFDQEYYAASEIRLPKVIPAKFIVGWMKK